MNKSKSFKWLMVATMAAVMCQPFIACSSDDDDDKKEESPVFYGDPFDKNSEEGLAFYNMLSQITNVGDSLPDNWKSGATFEPVEGMVLDQATPFVRSVIVESMDKAANFYNLLTDRNIDGTTSTDTWKIADAGTMTYTRQNAPNCFATIDVSIKQLTHLTQIRLVPKDATGLNGGFDGEPYYRYGDVVRDKDGCYWICVSPAHAATTETSHWISFQKNSSCIKSLNENTTALKTQYVPNNLSSQKDATRYLAQLLSVLSRIDEFKQKVGSTPFNAPYGFADLPVDVMSNSEIERVAKYWEQDGIWDKVKPQSMSTSNFKSYFNQNITFVYKGHSVMKNSPTLKLYVARMNDASNFFRGAIEQTVPEINMSNVSININEYADSGTGSSTAIGPKALMIRYKTGSNLAEIRGLSSQSPTNAISNVTTIYRFNSK